MNSSALEYADKFKWHVFPLAPRAKTPLTAHGFKDATTDAAQINQWWEQHPDANIGVACGASNLVVIDVDGAEGINNWNALQERHALDVSKTVVQRTGSGQGYQIFFLAPADVDIRNSAGKLAKGIDVRAQGGYVVIPPSIHPSGNQYEWEHDPQSFEIQPLPDALLKLLTEPAPKLTNGNGNGNGPRAHDAYIHAAIDGELANLRAAHNGTRNHTLNTAAFNLATLGLAQNEIATLLEPVALEVGLSPQETRKTIASGHRAGAQQPRAIPEPRFSNSNGHNTTHSAPSQAQAAQWQPLDDILRAFERSEAGDAELFAQMYADQIAYDHSEKNWYSFDANAWQRDRTGQITHLVTNQLAAQYLHAQAELKARGNENDAERIKELYKRANVLRVNGRIHNVLDLAAKNPLLALTGDEWHTDSMLLAVSNGVLNLRASEFEFRDGAPRDYLRDVIPTEWQGIDTPAPRWEQFLNEIFAGDTELVSFVRRLLGYGLTGQASEDKFPIFWGEGRNGKNTLFETLEYVLSSALAIPVQSEVLVDAGRNPNAATPHLIAMRGKRLVWVDETREGAFLNVGQVKMLTGGGTIAARPMYGASTTFRPTHLLMLMTNHKPHANADDYAFWQRALLIPFTQAFVDNPSAPNEHAKDSTLKVTLRAEASGILAWLVRGALEWQQHGLNPPASVLAATAEYRTKEDTLAEFIAEKCVTIPDAMTRAQEFYATYEQWAGESGYKPMSKRTFGERMAKRFERGHDRGGNFFRGVGIRDEGV